MEDDECLQRFQRQIYILCVSLSYGSLKKLEHIILNCALFKNSYLCKHFDIAIKIGVWGP